MTGEMRRMPWVTEEMLSQEDLWTLSRLVRIMGQGEMYSMVLNDCTVGSGGEEVCGQGGNRDNYRVQTGNSG